MANPEILSFMSNSDLQVPDLGSKSAFFWVAGVIDGLARGCVALLRKHCSVPSNDVRRLTTDHLLSVNSEVLKSTA